MTNHMCLPFWRFGKDFGCKGFGFEVVAFRSFIGFTVRDSSSLSGGREARPALLEAWERT